MNQQNKIYLKRTAVFLAVVLSVGIGVCISFRLAFFLLPFLIAFALSTIIEPLIRLLSDKLHIKRKLSAPIIILLLIGIIVFLVVLAVLRLIVLAKSLVAVAPSFLSALYDDIIEWTNTKGPELLSWLPDDVQVNIGSLTDNLGGVISNISNTITNFGKTIVKGAFTTAISLPEALIFTIITIVATFFMTCDRRKIVSVFVTHLPPSWVKKIVEFKNELFGALFGYIRAAMIILGITFTELFIGLLIIGVKYPLLLAIVIAFIDMLPVLGTGTVLIPWSIISFITGDTVMGISVLALYLFVLVVRQIIEPRIVGQQIGVYPLLTLLAMYTGLELIGFAGLIIGPIAFLLIRNIIMAIYKGKTFKEIIGYSAPVQDNEAAGAETEASAEAADPADTSHAPDTSDTSDASDTSCTADTAEVRE